MRPCFFSQGVGEIIESTQAGLVIAVRGDGLFADAGGLEFLT